MHHHIKYYILFISLLVANVVALAEPLEQAPALDADKAGAAVEIENKDIDNKTSDVDDYSITREEHPNNPCDRGLDKYKYEKNWYDESQIYINSSFCEPALWFDNFFATDRIFDEGVPGTYVRWRNDFTYDEENHFNYKARLNFSFVLPGFKNKLRLSFEGEQDEDLNDISGRVREPIDNDLSLQLDIKESARSKFNVSVSLTPRIRFRYRYTYPVYHDITLRLTQEVQWRDGVNSATSRFDYEQEFDTKFLFRSSTQAKVSESYDGVDWLQAFVIYQWINKKASLAYETSVNGITEPISKTIDYRVGVRFRKNFHREWLFYEVAPEITWPITLDVQRSGIVIDRRSKWRIFFRLEIHFGNAFKKRYQDYNRL